MKIDFFLGTAAELIKVYPLIVGAERRGWAWRVISSGQSEHNFWDQYQDFQLSPSNSLRWLASAQDLDRPTQALKWFVQAGAVSRRELLRRVMLDSGPGRIWVIHGDTLTALVGAFHGYRLKIPVLHVEAGLRSPFLWRPFPEEICRRLVSRMATIHAAPDEIAEGHLRSHGVRGRIVNTHGNTLLDAVQLVRSEINIEGGAVEGVVNIHRFENLQSEARWRVIRDTLLLASTKFRLTVVMHPQTRFKLNKDAELKRQLEAHGARIVERLPFSQFIALLKASDFLISDGGSNQEECFYLGKPCLLLRSETERREGLGENCVLSGFARPIIESFLENPGKYRRPAYFPHESPTEMILSALESST